MTVIGHKLSLCPSQYFRLKTCSILMASDNQFSLAEWHCADGVVSLEQTGPVEHTGAGFLINQAGQELRDDAEQLATRLDWGRLAGAVSAMQFEYILGEIDPHSDNGREHLPRG